MSLIASGTGTASLLSTTGKRKVRMNSEPLPFSVSSSMVPPMSSVRFLVMDMPRPVPWILSTASVFSREKESKMCSANSGDMPKPLSLTLMV